MRAGTLVKSMLTLWALAASGGLESASAYQAPPNPPLAGYTRETPASLSCIYQLVSPVAGCNPNNTSLPLNTTLGAGAIVVIGQYHTTNLQSDLAGYSSQFGLPAPQLTVVTTNGASSCYGPSHNNDLLGENTSLYFNCYQYGTNVLEMAHAMAPAAALIYVETGGDFSSLSTAIATATAQAKSHGGGEVVIAEQFPESSDQTSLESVLQPSSTNSGVLYFAAAGAVGTNSYPGTSPNVVAVSASDIDRDMENPANMGNFVAEKTGQAGAGGFSAYIPAPPFQSRIANRVGNTRLRAVPDIVATSNGNNNIWVYNNGSWIGASGPFMPIGIAAGIANAAGASNYFQSTASLLSSMYSKFGTTAFFDVGAGICGSYDGAFTTVADRASALDQWDFCSGIGAPRGVTGFRP